MVNMMKQYVLPNLNQSISNVTGTIFYHNVGFNFLVNTLVLGFRFYQTLYAVQIKYRNTLKIQWKCLSKSVRFNSPMTLLLVC